MIIWVKFGAQFLVSDNLITLLAICCLDNLIQMQNFILMDEI